MKDEWGTYLDDVIMPEANQSNLETDETIDQILYSICASFQMSAAVLGLVRGNEYTLYAVYDQTGHDLKTGSVLPLGAMYAQQVVNNQSPFAIENAAKDPIFQNYPEHKKWRFKSFLGVPVFNEFGQLIAVLSVLSQKTREFSEGDSALLTLLSRNVARILDHVFKQDETLKHQFPKKAVTIEPNQLDGLLKIARLSRSAATIDKIQLNILQEIIFMSRAKFGGIIHLNSADSAALTQVYGVTQNFNPVFNEMCLKQLATGPIAIAIRERRVISIGDLFADPLGKSLRENAEQWGYAAVICFPLIQHQQKVEDVVIIFYRLPQKFKSEVIKLLTAATNYLAAAISNYELLKQSETEQHLVSLINEVTNALTASLNFNDIFLTLVNQLEKIVDFDHANILLLNDDRVSLSLFALISSRASQLKEGQVFKRADEPLMWSVIEQRKISILRDIKQVKTSLNEILLNDGLNSMLALPLIYRGESLGIFFLASSKESNFSIREARILNQIAGPVASAIKNASLYVETEKQRETLDRINRDLHRLDQLKQELMDMIVHDLRNPLSGIIGYLALLMQYTELSEQQKEFVDLAKTNSETLLNMVNTLLDITKLEVGQMKIERRISDVSELIKKTIDQTRGMAMPKNVTLESRLSDSDLQSNCDSQLIVRVLVNLVGNAIKFVPESGSVTIDVNEKVEDGQTFTVFRVIDNGEGIPPEYHKKIFEKFGQVDIRKRGRKISTGLGLTFCKLAVEAHDGTIEVNSMPGKGSTFTFVIPNETPHPHSPTSDKKIS